MLPGERDVLLEFARDADEAIRISVGRGLYLISSTDRSVALDVLTAIDIGGLTSVASAVMFSFGRRPLLTRNWVSGP